MEPSDDMKAAALRMRQAFRAWRLHPCVEAADAYECARLHCENVWGEVRYAAEWLFDHCRDELEERERK